MTKSIKSETKRTKSDSREKAAPAAPVTPKAGDGREAILEAMRREALDGNVSAAKLLLTEYQEPPDSDEDILTVEKAIELLREWRRERKESGRSGRPGGIT